MNPYEPPKEVGVTHPEIIRDPTSLEDTTRTVGRFLLKQIKGGMLVLLWFVAIMTIYALFFAPREPAP
jgi:hypothetical protein